MRATASRKGTVAGGLYTSSGNMSLAHGVDATQEVSLGFCQLEPPCSDLQEQELGPTPGAAYSASNKCLLPHPDIRPPLISDNESRRGPLEMACFIAYSVHMRKPTPQGGEVISTLLLGITAI